MMRCLDHQRSKFQCQTFLLDISFGFSIAQNNARFKTLPKNTASHAQRSLGIFHHGSFFSPFFFIGGEFPWVGRIRWIFGSESLNSEASPKNRRIGWSQNLMSQCHRIASRKSRILRTYNFGSLGLDMFLKFISNLPSGKTKTAMENGPVEDVFPIEHLDFPLPS